MDSAIIEYRLNEIIFLNTSDSALEIKDESVFSIEEGILEMSNVKLYDTAIQLLFVAS
ncbi:MAG TPA: hypothetical protein PK079_08510 [Leptospiraceae bacterium]|nr:hypothetical protein [Leptospiraceae bacterium]HMW04361.1 hypothetical protein [Leptospiraceae bacterium]HMX31069.1 hypothetical protein [Leptospiraceae bacterium]HMY31885.1 hypothetical protein [Leptospiraceae bacterium]HMZ65243.1 hypothetical protein [Leptospiraceae bacterium]